jgi:hypothetical protein
MLSPEIIQNRENKHFAAQDKATSGIENIRGLNLEAAKLTTVQVTKLPLQLR